MISQAQERAGGSSLSAAYQQLVSDGEDELGMGRWSVGGSPFMSELEIGNGFMRRKRRWGSLLK